MPFEARYTEIPQWRYDEDTTHRSLAAIGALIEMLLKAAKMPQVTSKNQLTSLYWLSIVLHATKGLVTRRKKTDSRFVETMGAQASAPPRTTKEFIRSLRGKCKHLDLMNALGAARKEERQRGSVIENSSNSLAPRLWNRYIRGCGASDGSQMDA